MRISNQFDSGSIEVTAIDPAGSARLLLRKDVVSDATVDIRQWFHFRLQGARGKTVDLCIENASRATFPGGWPGYRACASYDRVNWFRVPTTYVDGKLTISHTPERDSIYYAYFEPYSWDRHLQLLGRADASPLARVHDLGSTPEGRDMNVVEIAAPKAAAQKHCWIIARQHPGETMAEWLVEGLIDRLLDEGDAVSRQLLTDTTFHIVPNMNPDGSVHGNLRVNTTGANLNREWMTPSVERSPEVLCVRAAMEQTGCDFFLDVHGDETIPHVFVAGCEMLPTVTPEQNAAQDRYVQCLLNSADDFQTRHGYTADRYSSDALKLASKWAGHRFGCVSLTLELPFKDHNDRPDHTTGWSASRSMRLGRDVLTALARSAAR
jgi:murein tripeptide amidase MpaA